METVKEVGNSAIPFSLERYFFTRTICIPTSGYRKKDARTGQIRVKASLANKKDTPSKWKIGLAVGLSEETDRRRVPYNFAIDVEGFFLASGEIVASMVYTRGAPMLYAIVTEYLRNITAAGPYGSLILPLYDFPPGDLALAGGLKGKTCSGQWPKGGKIIN